VNVMVVALILGLAVGLVLAGLRRAARPSGRRVE
jgi:hypothetical protein